MNIVAMSEQHPHPEPVIEPTQPLEQEEEEEENGSDESEDDEKNKDNLATPQRTP